jgi:hypothetical protein
MELKTIDEVIIWSENEEDLEIQAICIIAKEIKELKKREATNSLLIQHEEQVRTTKAKPIAGGKNVKTKFKVGDIVDYNPVGTTVWCKARIDNLSKGKFDITLLQSFNVPKFGIAGIKKWVGSRQLRFHLAKVS